jgi:hypothetical protein
MPSTSHKLKDKDNQSVKVGFTKREVERQFRQAFNANFSIELHESVVYVHSDLELEIEIPYASTAEKADIYHLLALLASRSDFSYHLSFTTLASLQAWHDNYDASLQQRLANASFSAR